VGEAQRLARERVERRRGDLVARAVAIGSVGADVVGAHAVEADDHDAHPLLGDGRARGRGSADRLRAAVIAQEREGPATDDRGTAQCTGRQEATSRDRAAHGRAP
jgi:hypothetical protein